MTTKRTNLAHLIAAAANGTTASIDTNIPLDTAARLYAAAARDLDEGNYGSATDDAGRLPVELETSDEDTATVNVNGLRYVIELEIGAGSDTVTPLCEVSGCPNPALSRTRLARICDGHLDETTPLTQGLHIPAEAVRTRRLDAWEKEIAEIEDRLAHRDRIRLKRLREGS